MRSDITEKTDKNIEVDIQGKQGYISSVSDENLVETLNKVAENIDSYKAGQTVKLVFSLTQSTNPEFTVKQQAYFYLTLDDELINELKKPEKLTVENLEKRLPQLKDHLKANQEDIRDVTTYADKSPDKVEVPSERKINLFTSEKYAQVTYPTEIKISKDHVASEPMQKTQPVNKMGILRGAWEWAKENPKTAIGIVAVTGLVTAGFIVASVFTFGGAAAGAAIGFSALAAAGVAGPVAASAFGAIGLGIIAGTFALKGYEKANPKAKGRNVRGMEFDNFGMKDSVVKPHTEAKSQVKSSEVAAVKDASEVKNNPHFTDRLEARSRSSSNHDR